MKKIFLFTALTLTSTTFASDKAIYGTDSRIDVNESKNAVHKRMANSVAVMIPEFVVWDTDKDKTSFMDLNLKDTMKVCDAEPFAHQQTVATCTGFLVAPNLLVTAGHCVKSEADCGHNKWVFDYKVKKKSDTTVGSIPNSSIYSCKKIVESKLSSSLFSKKDWAIIELDRPVKDRAPLKLSKKAPSRGDNLYVIGAPSGLPLKIATGVVRSKKLSHFSANLDTFAGNSGSPVFNSKTNQVEGILVRGDNDYTEIFGRCLVSTTYKENGGRGEDVSYIKNVRALLK